MDMPPAPIIPTPLLGLPFSGPPSHLLTSINSAMLEASSMLDAHPDKHAALVGTVDLQGVNAALLVRVADGWQVRGYVGEDWKGTFQAKAEILGVF